MDNGDDNWDLAAIVRSCCCPSSSSSSSSYSKRRYEIAADSPLILLENVDSNGSGATDRFKVQVRREDGFLGFCGEKFETKSRRSEGEGGGLEVLYSPFSFRKAAVAGVSKRVERAAAAAVQTTSPRAKRRKKQLKKVVCQVPADGVSPDMWSWRKYGQKPIKGSPFPRGYYRCSTIRGCPARKQVERDRNNPGQLVVTYTSEHNHPMPTNHGYPPTTPSESKVEEKIPTSPATSVSHDNGEQEKEQGEETLMVEDMEVIGEDDLIFVGDDSLLADGGSFSDDRIFASPWFEKGGSHGSSNATAAAC